MYKPTKNCQWLWDSEMVIFNNIHTIQWWSICKKKKINMGLISLTIQPCGLDIFISLWWSSVRNHLGFDVIAVWWIQGSITDTHVRAWHCPWCDWRWHCICHCSIRILGCTLASSLHGSWPLLRQMRAVHSWLGYLPHGGQLRTLWHLWHLTHGTHLRHLV